LKGDATGAESAMRQHIQNSAAVIMGAPDTFFSA
jgi:DNA-binding FadR family transcriptional regulator